MWAYATEENTKDGSQMSTLLTCNYDESFRQALLVAVVSSHSWSNGWLVGGAPSADMRGAIGAGLKKDTCFGLNLFHQSPRPPRPPRRLAIGRAAEAKYATLLDWGQTAVVAFPIAARFWRLRMKASAGVASPSMEIVYRGAKGLR